MKDCFTGNLSNPMKINTIWFLYFVFLGLLFSCKKDPEISTPGALDNGCFIVNEGNYNWGNASIDFYDFESESISSDLFQKANNRPLGDVFQSMIVHNKNAYLVVNNSGKIEVCNPATMESVATINGLNSPRHILPLSDTKFYVTDLYDKNISVVNPLNASVSKKIPLKYWTERLLMAENKVFVCAMKTNYVFVLDPVNDVVIDSIQVGYSPSSIVKGNNGNLFVLSEGSSIAPVQNSSLTEFHPVHHSIINQWTLSSIGARCLRANQASSELYFIFNKDVYRYTLGSAVFAIELLISGQTRNFYGLNIRPDNGDVYVFDAKDYVQRGALLIYDSNGILKKEVKTGIIPSAAYF